MANIKKVTNKGGTAYKITVFSGRDADGKQIRHYLTWQPDRKMTDRQAEKEVQKVAFQFEEKLKQGFVADNRQTFAEYAEYVLDLKKQEGCKYRTLERYGELLERITPAIGHIKLLDIRPQHLNALYKNLAEVGVSDRGDKATKLDSVDIAAMLKAKKITRAKLSEAVGASPTTITALCKGKTVEAATAEGVAKVLGKQTKDLFALESGKGTLSPKTILEHHRLIHTILAQAEKEMLVPYNAAAKATPPKAAKSDPNYFQPEQIAAIWDALEKEPLKWQVIVHLLAITGCRRGEIMGLRWDRVDFKNSQIKIDTNLLYSSKREEGDKIYIDTTKTDTSYRFIKLPPETMQLLKEYHREYLQTKLLLGEKWNDTGFLFTKLDGTPMIPDSITAWLAKFSRRHNLPHINPHAFRHSMASILIQNGQDIVSVSKRLGHAQTSTTANIYAHIIAEADERAADCIAGAILRKNSKTG